MKQDGLNVLGMVVFSIFLGVILGRMGPRGKPLIDLFDCMCEATMQLVRLVIWYGVSEDFDLWSIVVSNVLFHKYHLFAV